MYEDNRYEKYKPIYDEWIKLYPFTTESLDGEIWLPIPNYEGLYDCSNFGRVKSFWFGKEKIMKPQLDTKGYLGVNLVKAGKVKRFTIARLVGRLFIPNPLNLPEVDLKDGVKFNCHVSNLYWTTSSENKNHDLDIGRRKSGQDRPEAKLTNEQVIYIRQNPDGLTTKQLAEKFGVIRQTISGIQCGLKRKRCGGVIREKILHPANRTPDDKRAQIIADYQKGVPGHGYAAVAKRFGVSPQNVWDIVNGRR